MDARLASLGLLFMGVVRASPNSSTLTCGGQHCCALFGAPDEGLVKCWGTSGLGQLGGGDAESIGDQPNEMGAALPVVDWEYDEPITSVVAGSWHTCALFEDGLVKCVGQNEKGQLGLGDKFNRGGGELYLEDENGDLVLDEAGEALPLGFAELNGEEATTAAIALTAGDQHTCALLHGGCVKCWGANYIGQLGYGDQEDRGDEEGEMGEALDCVDLGEGVLATQISAGADYTCAVTANEDEEYLGLKCWGGGDQGQLGLGDNAFRGISPAEMGDALPFVDFGDDDLKVLSLASGSLARHNCAAVTGGLLYCWGGNQYGQLGQEDTENRLEPELVDVGTDAVVVQAAFGEQHTCCTLADGAGVKCWGAGTRARLGYPEGENVGDLPMTMGDNLEPVDLDAEVVQVTSGRVNNCAQTQGGGVKCWGEGVLGYGEYSVIGDEVEDMGENLEELDLAGKVSTPQALSPLDDVEKEEEEAEEEVEEEEAVESEEDPDTVPPEEVESRDVAEGVTADVQLELAGESVATFTADEETAMLKAMETTVAPYPVSLLSKRDVALGSTGRRLQASTALEIVYSVGGIPDDETAQQVVKNVQAAISNGSLVTEYSNQYALTDQDNGGNQFSAIEVTGLPEAEVEDELPIAAIAGGTVGGVVFLLAMWWCCGGKDRCARRARLKKSAAARAHEAPTSDQPKKLSPEEDEKQLEPPQLTAPPFASVGQVAISSPRSGELFTCLLLTVLQWFE
ncbi:unnamed protein product [Chrysoparadoxa australica]